VKLLKHLNSARHEVELYEFGRGEPLLFLHGAGGLLGTESFLEQLGRDFRVIAPHLPGYGESTGGELIEDVFDAVLFYHELMDELDIAVAHVMGHSMGGMLAAELAAFDVHRVKRLVLVTPAGFWLDLHPIADFCAADFKDVPALLFHDPNSDVAKLMMTMPDDPQALTLMYVERQKRLAMASKFLWPIPDRGLKKRAYRIAAPTMLLWGNSDRLIPKVYADEFLRHIRDCRLEIIEDAGHMVMYEKPEEFCRRVLAFLKQ
jgi:pimeloyl-ACP methyl ester carboxylesterase